jgi:hypothetical protein
MSDHKGAALMLPNLPHAPPDEAGAPPGPPPSPSLPAVRRAILDRLFSHLVTPIRCPHCRRRFLAPHHKMPR